ncbi:MAG: Gfo/Idh/MocA family oxidoreductase [Tetrasphaera sp.]
MRPLRWALLGASDIAASRMLPAIRGLGGEAAAVLSGSPDHARAYAAANGIERATTELDTALDGVDVAYISSHNPKHAEQARAALSAGVHVLCEKPITLDLREAVGLIHLSRQQDLVFAVNHHLPCSSVLRTLASMAREDAIGSLLGMRINHAFLLRERLRGWRLEDVPGGGVILDITVHDAAVIGLLREPPPATAAAQTVRQGPWPKGAPDAVMTVLRWEDDFLAQTHDAYTVPYNSSSIDIYGTEGSLHATDALTQDPIGDLQLRTSSGMSSVEVGERKDLYAVSVGAFTRAVTEGEAPAVSAIAGTQAVAVALAVEEAARSGRTVDVTDVARVLTLEAPNSS